MNVGRISPTNSCLYVAGGEVKYARREKPIKLSKKSMSETREDSSPGSTLLLSFLRPYHPLMKHIRTIYRDEVLYIMGRKLAEGGKCTSKGNKEIEVLHIPSK